MGNGEAGDPGAFDPGAVDDAAERSPGGPLRGDLRVRVTTSTDGLVAGHPFSIFVHIENPYDVPIELLSIGTFLPPDFENLDPPPRPGGAAGTASATAASPAPGPGRRSWRAANRPGRSFQSAIARAVSPEDVPDATLEPTDGVGTAAQPLATAGGTAAPAGAWPVLLQPGNTTTRVFALKARWPLNFRPAVYRLTIEVRFRGQGAVHRQSVERTFRVRASIRSMAAGAAVGGLAGWVVSTRHPATGWETSAAGALMTVVVSVMAVVVFARKREARPLVTVEDFWGGVATGFLTGLAGPAVLESLIDVETAPPA
jgi:hypothetical protein